LPVSKSHGRHGWRATIWTLVALYVALALWWLQPRSVPADPALPVATRIPSEWTEQARVTAPDRRLDAVLLHADPSEAFHYPATAQQPAWQHRLPREQNETSHRIMCVRIIPAGARVDRESPYLHTTLHFMGRVRAQSVYVSYYTPDLKLTWEDANTLLIDGPTTPAVHQLEETTISDAQGSRTILVKYRIPGS
jgi:hypothetical protein